MYADRVAAGVKRSIKDRLNGNSDDEFVRVRQPGYIKRQRQSDEKWKHDLYNDNEGPQVSNPRLGVRDLRLKLQRKSELHAQPSRGTHEGVRDLREKLAGTMHSQPANADIPKTKPTTEALKTVRKSTASAEAIISDQKKVNNPASSKKKTQQKADSSIGGFLQSLGLEKYLIQFQAEEVDMAALMHMTDDDLKAIGIPMAAAAFTLALLLHMVNPSKSTVLQGPRKKILLAMESRN